MTLLAWVAIVVGVLVLIDVYTLAKGSYRYAQKIEHSLLIKIQNLEQKIQVFEEEKHPRKPFDEEIWFQGK